MLFNKTPKNWNENEWIDEVIKRFQYLDSEKIACNIENEVFKIYKQLEPPPEQDNEWIDEKLIHILNIGKISSEDGIQTSTSIIDKVKLKFITELLVYPLGNELFSLTTEGLRAKQIGSIEKYKQIKKEENLHFLKQKTFNKWIIITSIATILISIASFIISYLTYQNLIKKDVELDPKSVLIKIIESK